MNYAEAMANLARLGTEQNRKIAKRHGVAEPLFGVEQQSLDRLRKISGVDTELARALWASGNHDARIFATQIADPSELDPDVLETWSRDLDNYILSDALAKLASGVAGARQTAEAWIESDEEWIGRAGWITLTHLLRREDVYSDAEAEAFLPQIEQRIGEAQNRVKDAMLNALIAIGGRGEELGEKALAASARIGKVQVDHGRTGCKTPDPESMIRKMLARKAAKR